MPPGRIAIVVIRGDYSKNKMAAIPKPQQFYPNCADKIASRCFDPPMRRGACFLKTKPVVTIMSFIVLLSMLFQAWLGKLVVDSNLSPYKITVHMLMAIVILSLIIFIYKKSDVKKN